MKNVSAVFFIVFVFVLGCEKQPVYDIRGEWNYLLYEEQRIWDNGTITFTGDLSSGDYLLINFYDVEYRGIYRVRDDSMEMTGDQFWEATFLDENLLEGKWILNGKKNELMAVRIQGQ